MLGFLFGFNMRLRRLQFFLTMIGFGIFAAVVLFALVGRMPHSGQIRGDIAFALNSGQVIVAIIVLTVISLQLQCMRFRDIGWDPVCVMPGWIALMIIDNLIATKFPALSFTHEHTGTIVGALVNLGLGLAMMFWPSGDAENSSSSADEPRQTSDGSWRSRSAPPATANRIARVSNGEFGGRAN
jgi:uncharacterized membrane protein YhaH (DUF805 family)